jgi:hypothetical protein
VDVGILPFYSGTIDDRGRRVLGPSRAPLRREGNSLLFSEASGVKLIRGLFGSTKADDHVRPRR